MTDLKQKLAQYVDLFNRQDEEICSQAVPNSEALDFLARQIPLLECPDPDLERTYYFRWWTFRKHIRTTPEGQIITEFLPDVSWAGAYNSINAAAGFHFREGRWLRGTEELFKSYLTFWMRGSGNEQSGWRPGVVFQNNVGNACSPNLIALPLTSSLKKLDMPTHVLVHAHDSGLKLDSVVLCENPQCISKSKVGRYITTLPAHYLKEIAIAHLLATSAASFIDLHDLAEVRERSARLNGVA